MRPCSFTPSAGRYADQRCLGYQIILRPGAQYHSLLHTLEMMRWFAERYSQFEMLPELHVKVADPVISEYLRGGITFDIVQEHVKAEEQKFIRKAKRYTLYDEQTASFGEDDDYNQADSAGFINLFGLSIKERAKLSKNWPEIK